MSQQINIALNFSANTQQAQASLQNLQTQLTKIAYGSNDIKVNPGQIEQASSAAKELAFHLNQAYNANTGNIDLTRLQTSLKSAGTSVTQLSSNLLSAGQTGQQAFVSLAQSIAMAEAPVLRVNNLVSNLWRTFGNTLRYQLSSNVISGFTQAISGAVSYVKELDTSLNNIRIVTGYSAEEMSKFAVEANKAAKALSTTTTAYTDASLIFYQQGLTGDAVKERADVVVKLANVTGQSAEIVSDQMTAIWNNFDDGSKSMEYYADVITKLGAATASSTDEISDGLEKFAAVAETVGLSYEMATASLATVTAETRQSADVVGTAFKTIFSRMEGLQLGETLEDGTTLNKYSEALAIAGVNIKEQNGQMKEMDNILSELGTKWQTLGKDQQIALAQAVAGVRQYNQFIALMSNWDKVQENLGVAAGSTGELNTQAEIFADSWEAAKNRVTASLEAVYSDIFKEDFFKDFMDTMAHVLNGIDGFLDGVGGIGPVLMGVASVALGMFANQVPAALQGLKNNLLITFGQGTKVINQMNAETQELIQNELNVAQSGRSYTELQKQQLTNAANLSNLKAKLALADKNLSDAERTKYNFEIQGIQLQQQELEGLADIITKEKERINILKEQLSINQQKINSNNTDSEHLKRLQRTKTNVEGRMTFLDANPDLQEDNNEYAQLEAQLERINAAIERAKIRSQEFTSYMQTAAQGLSSQFAESLSSEGFSKTMESSFDLDTSKITSKLEEFKYATENGLSSIDFSPIRNSVQTISEAFTNENGELTAEGKKMIETVNKIEEKLFTSKDKRGTNKMIESLIKQLTGVKVPGQQAQKVLKALGIEMDELVGSAKKADEATDKLTEAEKRLKQQIDQIDFKHTVKGTEALSSAMSGIGSMVFGLQSLSSAFEALSNPDLSGWDKFLSVTMSLTMAFPMFTSGIKSFGTFFSFFNQQAMDYANTLSLTNGILAQQSNGVLALNSNLGILLGTEKAKALQDEIDMAINLAQKESEEELTDEIKEQIAAKVLGSQIDNISIGQKLALAAANLIGKGATEGSTRAVIAQTIANWGLQASMWPLLLIALALVAAIAAVVAVVMLFVNAVKNAEANKPENIFKAMNEEAAKAEEEFNKTKEAMDSLRESVEKLDESYKAIEKMKTGTQEWTQAVLEHNIAMLDLLETYPELYNLGNNLFEFDKNGVMKFSKGAQEKINNFAVEKIIKSQLQMFQAKNQARSYETSLENSERTKQTSQNLGSRLWNSLYVDSYKEALEAEDDSEQARIVSESIKLSSDVYSKITQAVKDGVEINESTFQDIKNIPEDFYNQFEPILNEAYKVELENTQALEANTAQLRIQAQTLTGILLNNNSNYQFLSDDQKVLAQRATTERLTELQGEVAQMGAAFYDKELKKSEHSDFGTGEGMYLKNLAPILGYSNAQDLGLAIAREKKGETAEENNKKVLSAGNVEVDENGYYSTSGFVQQGGFFGAGDSVTRLGQITFEKYQNLMQKELGEWGAVQSLDFFEEVGKGEQVKVTYVTDKNTTVDGKDYKAGETITETIQFSEILLALQQDYLTKQSEQLSNEAVNLIKTLGEEETKIALGGIEKIKNAEGQEVDAINMNNLSQEQMDKMFTKTEDGKYSDIKEGTLTEDELKGIALGLGEAGKEYYKINEQGQIILQNTDKLNVAIKEGAAQWDPEKAKMLAQQADEAAANSIFSQNAEALETSEEALEGYAAHLETVNDELKGQKALTAQMAVTTTKQTKGLEKANKALEDNADALKDTNKGTIQYYEALAEVGAGLEEAFGVKVNAQFLETGDNLEKVKKAIDGDAESLKWLQKEMAKKYALQIATENQDIFNINITDFQKKLDDLQNKIPDLKVGASISLDGEGDFVESLNQIIASAGMTTEQVNQYLGNMGFTASYASEPQEVITETPPTIRTQRVLTSGTVESGTYTYDETSWEVPGTKQKTSYEVGTVAMETSGINPNTGAKTYKVPKINKITKNAQPSGNGGSRNGKGGSGGGGSKKQPKEKKKKSDEIERYHEITNSLEAMGRELDRISAKKEHAFGKEKLKLMEQEYNALQKNIKLQDKYIKEIDKNLAIDKSAIVKIGVTFDKDGNINNYDEIVGKWVDEYNAAVNKFNTSGQSESDEKALEEAEKLYEERIKLLEQYEETLDLKQDEELARLEIQNEMIQQATDIFIEAQEQRVEAFEKAIDAYDSKLDYLSRKMERLEEKEFQQAKAASLLGSSIETSLNKTQDNISAYYTALSAWNDIKDGVDSKGRKVSEEAKETAWENLKSAAEVLGDSQDELLDFQQQLSDLVISYLEDQAEAFDELGEKVEFLNGLLENYANIMELLGRKYEDFDIIQSIADNQVAASQRSLEIAKAEYQRLAKEMQEIQNTGDEEAIKEITAQVDEARTAMLDAWSAGLEAVAHQYEVSITNLVKTTEKQLSKFYSLEEAQEFYDQNKSIAELYLEEYDSLYQLNKLTRDINKSMRDQDSLLTNQKLSTLLDEINEKRLSGAQMSQHEVDMLQKKYNLRLAEIALEEAQNAKSQMRLTRDASGNWSYTYTADQSKIDEATQKHEDALYEIEKASKEYIDEMSEAILSNEEEMMSRISELKVSDYATEEEYIAAIELIRDQHMQKNRFYYSEIEKAIGDVNTAYGEEKIAFEDLTIAKIKNINSASQGLNTFEESTITLLEGMVEAYKTHSKGVEEFAATMGGNIGQAVKGIGDEIATTDDKMKDLVKTIKNSFADMMSKLSPIFETLSTAIDGTVGNLDKLIENFLKLQNVQSGANTGYYDEGIDYNSKLTSMAGKKGSDASDGTFAQYLWERGNKVSSPEYAKYAKMGGQSFPVAAMLMAAADKNAIAKEWLNNTKKGKSTDSDKVKAFIESYDKNMDYTEMLIAFLLAGGDPKKDKSFEQVWKHFVTKLGETVPGTNQTYRKKYYDGKDNKEVWNQLMNSNEYLSAEAIPYPFDTGGYTGEWGPEGKLAILHQKELVLNAGDTENFLKSMELMGHIISVIDRNAMLAAAGLALGQPIAAAVNDKVVQQTVAIEASFPGVQSAAEIEQALNNIVNDAAQYASIRKN